MHHDSHDCEVVKALRQPRGSKALRLDEGLWPLRKPASYSTRCQSLDKAL
jgi:hypothetical protein